MSEHQNCGTRDFSEYDSMETQELEAILRQDAEATDEQESDTEKILYIAGVLAKRENKNNTGNEAQIAWESFEKDYLPMEEVCEYAARSKKPVGLWVRRLTTVAAVLVLVIGLSATMVSAFGWNEVWSAVAKWARETFSFVSNGDAELTEPDKRTVQEYTSLQEALNEMGRDYIKVPTRIPDGYVLDRIVVDENPMQRIFIAYYKNDDKSMKIAIQSYLDADPEKIEINDNIIEMLTIDGLECYIFSNNEQICAAWAKDSYECLLSGDLTLDEIKTMINSIGKG